MTKKQGLKKLERLQSKARALRDKRDQVKDTWSEEYCLLDEEFIWVRTQTKMLARKVFES